MSNNPSFKCRDIHRPTKIGRPPEAFGSTSEAIGSMPEDLPGGHAHSEKYKRSSPELILVLDFVPFTSIAWKLIYGT